METTRLEDIHLQQLAEEVADNRTMFLSREQCAQRYGISARTWDRWTRAGVAPQPFCVGDRYRRWGVKQLAAWEASGGKSLGDIHEQDRRDTDAMNTSAWTATTEHGPRVSQK